MIANRGANADHPGLKLFAVDRKAISAREPQFFLQPVDVGDGVRGECRQALVGNDPIEFGRRQPGQDGLSGCGGVRSIRISAQPRIHAHGVPGVATQNVDQVGILHDRKVHGFAGLIVEPIDKTLRPPRQINLAKTGGAEVKDSRPQNVAAAVRAARDIAPIVQGRNQVMTGRYVQSGDIGDFGQLRLAAGVGDDVEDKKRPVERLDAAVVTPHRRPGRHDALPLFASFGLHRRSPPGGNCLRPVGPNRRAKATQFSHRRY